MSLSVDTRLDSMALNIKRPREYIPAEMPEYLIKLKFDRQVKVGRQMKSICCIDYTGRRRRMFLSFYIIDSFFYLFLIKGQIRGN